MEKSPFNRQRVKLGLPPANTLLARGASTLPSMPSFKDKWGVSSACVAGTPLEKGIAQAAGMQVLKVRGATGRSDTDLMGKFQAAKNALAQGFGFVFVHVKAADSFSHDGDALGKKEFIQRVDAALSLWLDLGQTLVVTTADHSSPCELRSHSGTPVPLLFSGPGVRRDSVRQFGERECAKGGMGRLNGRDLMPEIVNICGKAALAGC